MTTEKTQYKIQAGLFFDDPPPKRKVDICIEPLEGEECPPHRRLQDSVYLLLKERGIMEYDEDVTVMAHVTIPDTYMVNLSPSIRLIWTLVPLQGEMENFALKLALLALHEGTPLADLLSEIIGEME